MALFEEKMLIFKTVGDSKRWKAAKKTLRDAGFRGVEAACFEKEMPTCGCGAKIDQQFLSPYGKLDRRVYYIAVRPEDAEQAGKILLTAVGTPLVSEEQVYPAPKKRSALWRKTEDFLNRHFA